MYIEPFWCGVFATIITEIILILIWAFHMSYKITRQSNSGKGDTYEQNIKGTENTDNVQERKED